MSKVNNINMQCHPLSDVQAKNIGFGTKVWQFVVILDGAQIGSDCNLCSHCFIESDVVVGDRVTVKCGVQLWDGLRVGNDVFIGPNVTFTNDKHPKSHNVGYEQQYTWIQDGASIGGGAVVLPGINIGKNAVVGAGAVVTKDVPDGVTVIGNPARVLNKV